MLPKPLIGGVIYLIITKFIIVYFRYLVAHVITAHRSILFTFTTITTRITKR